MLGLTVLGREEESPVGEETVMAVNSSVEDPDKGELDEGDFKGVGLSLRESGDMSRRRFAGRCRIGDDCDLLVCFWLAHQYLPLAKYGMVVHTLRDEACLVVREGLTSGVAGLTLSTGMQRWNKNVNDGKVSSSAAEALRTSSTKVQNWPAIELC